MLENIKKKNYKKEIDSIRKKWMILEKKQKVVSNNLRLFMNLRKYNLNKDYLIKNLRIKRRLVVLRKNS